MTAQQGARQSAIKSLTAPEIYEATPLRVRQGTATETTFASWNEQAIPPPNIPPRINHPANRSILE